MATKIPDEKLPNKFKSISQFASWCLKNRIGLYGRTTPQARSKFFEDYKRGVLVVEDPKCISRDEALRYFAVAGLTVIEKGNPAFDGDLFEKKILAEIRALELRAKKAEFELSRERGEYLKKDEVYLETAIKISAFEAGFKTLVRVNSVDWIHMVGGDPQKADMFCELVYAEVDNLLDEFGKMDEIAVVITKGPPPWAVGADGGQDQCV